MELLLSKGALIEARARYNYTPLHFAAQDGHTSIVELLLSKGASAKAVDDNNNTPLFYAEHKNHSDTVQLLKNELGNRV